MTAKSYTSVKLFLPGIFLLLLGVGNIGVGVYKGGQYQQVIEELSEHHSSAPTLVNASPLRRLELSRQTATRLTQRQSKAKARRDFYQLVTFGGKVFVMMSIVFLLLGLTSRYFERGHGYQPTTV